MKITFLGVRIVIEAKNAKAAYAILEQAIDEMGTLTDETLGGVVEWDSGEYIEDNESDEQAKDTGTLTF
ncbi:MAG: hypothetical protein ACW99U_19240 [Candidatus Thorarchaeota archaeon]|jgi:hypothetical protein